jgi:hypothetical protein
MVTSSAERVATSAITSTLTGVPAREIIPLSSNEGVVSTG